MREQLIAYAIKYEGEWDCIARALQKQENWKIEKNIENCIVLGDNLYPKAFLSLQKPPFVLFYKGNTKLLNTKMLCVVGTRTPTADGQAYTNFLFQHVDQRFCIVSGLAKGIDALAHQAALQAGLDCVGIVGSGLDVIYPKENQLLWEQMMKNGLLLSEYPPKSKPLKHHFVMRNRLLAALASQVIVIEAKAHSGTMHTVNEALLLSKDVWTFPHSILNKEGAGCNQLIEDGALMIKDLEDIKDIQ